MSARRRGSPVHILLGLAAVVAIAGCGDAARRGTRPSAAVSAKLDWQRIPLSDLRSRPVTLAQVLGGHPALVNLWAPWCARCKVELADLDRLARRLEGCAVVVGVAVGEDATHTADFVSERGLGYTQVVDESFHLADALGQSRVPTTLIVDRDGAIVHVGPEADGAAVGALESLVRSCCPPGGR
ncbi:MAG TPA: redoxin domain-containing protein [Polyangia bacterium]|nr:redoxin domain-containing protein [Polyangia bacterium]